MSVRPGTPGSPSARRWLPGGGVLLATLVLCAPLLGSPGHLPLADDTSFAAQSAQGFVQALGEGVAYPRWVDAANLGLGAPTFVFYPPLAYYAVGLLSFALGGDVLAGLRWTVVLAGLLSGLAFVAAFRSLVAPPALAAGAALWVLAPYHVLDLYWRFALAEYVAFAWLPLLLLFARRAVEGRGAGGVAGLAACYGGLVLTHLVTAFLAPLVLAPWLLLRLWRSGRWRRGIPVAVGGLLGLALAGAYLGPVLIERDAVRLEWVREAPYADYRDWFVLGSWEDLRGDASRLEPRLNRSAAVQALLALAAVGVLAPGLRRRPAGASRSGAGSGADEGVAQAGVAAWALALQLPVAAPLWRALPGLATVQFPWRFQVFQSLAGCALLALAASRLEGGPWPAGRREAVLRALLLGSAAAAMLWVAADCVSPRGVGFGPDWFAHPGTRHRVLREYLPRHAPPARALPRRPGPPARLEGAGEWLLRGWTSHERRFEVQAPAPAVLHVRTFAYPGWTARLDGTEVEIRAAAPLGSIALDVPAGEHDVHLAFEPTPGRRWGLVASAAAALALLSLAVGRRRPRAGA